MQGRRRSEKERKKSGAGDGPSSAQCVHGDFFFFHFKVMRFEIFFKKSRKRQSCDSQWTWKPPFSDLLQQRRARRTTSVPSFLLVFSPQKPTYHFQQSTFAISNFFFFFFFFFFLNFGCTQRGALWWWWSGLFYGKWQGSPWRPSSSFYILSRAKTIGLVLQLKRERKRGATFRPPHNTPPPPLFLHLLLMCSYNR